uniref:Phage tail fibre protein N-terminal domain-containing protein n=1 Tax=viral metagenome TaxID=1070528 RepID=A0A6M3KNJ0_9ZZZZ
MSAINQGVVLTTIGEALLDNAGISGKDLQLTQFSIGDAGGVEYNPTYEQLRALTAIPGEWDRRNISQIYENPEGSGYIVESVQPHDVGAGKWCAIVGYWTADSKLFAVHLIPRWQKPSAGGPTLAELPIRAYFTHSATATITLAVNPSMVTATRSWVTAGFATKAELAAALAALEAKINQPPVLDAPGVLPLSGDVFINVAGNFQLQIAPENSLLVITVSAAAAGIPQLLPPANEVLKTIRGDVAIARLVTVGVPYRFLRKNNVWRQL